jgi:pyrroloquinoline quinone biosynthesis protein B
MREGEGHQARRLRAVVLGSGAGGGVPQWNCRCRVCALAWAGDPRVSRRTQSSLAVSAVESEWVLVNASPDLRAQILATPALQPRNAGRDSPIVSVVMTNGDVDHVAGLLTLREKQPLKVFATAETLGAIGDNPIFDVLDDGLVERSEIAPARPVEVGAGITVEPFLVPGKVPLYLEGDTVEVGTTTGSTIGLTISGGGRTLHYVPGCARVTADLKERLAGGDALLFDGTVFRDDEMIREGVGTKTGARMGHIAIDGPDGSLAALRDVPLGRRLYVHINNTNPILIDGSPERRIVEAAGWEVGADGAQIDLGVMEEVQ